MRACPNPYGVTAFPFRLDRIVRPETKGNLQMQESSESQFLRLPGLFRRWELSQIIEPGEDFRIEDAGSAADGTPLYSIYATDTAHAPVNPRTATGDD
jgi:hypothetical protein